MQNFFNAFYVDMWYCLTFGVLTKKLLVRAQRESRSRSMVGSLAKPLRWFTLIGCSKAEFLSDQRLVSSFGSKVFFQCVRVFFYSWMFLFLIAKPVATPIRISLPCNVMIPNGLGQAICFAFSEKVLEE